MKFTLVSTIFNEASRLKRTIKDLNNQSLLPTELIITDAGSTDGTYEMLIEWSKNSNYSIKVFQIIGCNVAEGRNFAIKNSKYDLIVSTDFGCQFEKLWLETLISPFQDSNIFVVGGNYYIKENEQKSLAAKASYLITKGYQTNINSENFVPSSRTIAYRKEVYQKIGGYCEWLTLAGDDMVFGLCIKSTGINIHKSLEKLVSWDRHEKIKSYLKESKRYGLGEGEAKINKFNFIKNFTSITLQVIFIVYSVIIARVYIIGREIKLIELIFLLIASISFKSIISIFRYWMTIKSSKYTFITFLFSIHLNSIVKFHYILGYIEGFFFSKNQIKSESKILHKKFKLN